MHWQDCVNLHSLTAVASLEYPSTMLGVICASFIPSLKRQEFAYVAHIKRAPTKLGLKRTEELKESRESRESRVQANKGRLLRDKGRSGTIVPAGAAAPAGAEPDPAAAEAEERREREVAIGVRRELVTSAVDVELFPLNLAFGVGQQHDADCEGSETELVGREDLTCPAHRTALVTETELSRDDEDVVILLLVAELLEHLRRLGVLSQVLRSELAVTVVVELPLGPDHREHLLDRFAVRRRELLPLRNGEPSLGVRGKRLVGQLLIGEADTREELTQDVGLLGDPLDLVAFGVRVARLHFLVSELVGHRELFDTGHDASLELVTVLDELLDAVLVESRLFERTQGGVLDKAQVLFLLSIRDGRDRLCRHRHPP